MVNYWSGNWIYGTETRVHRAFDTPDLLCLLVLEGHLQSVLQSGVFVFTQNESTHNSYSRFNATVVSSYQILFTCLSAVTWFNSFIFVLGVKHMKDFGLWQLHIKAVWVRLSLYWCTSLDTPLTLLHFILESYRTSKKLHVNMSTEEFKTDWNPLVQNVRKVVQDTF